MSANQSAPQGLEIFEINPDLCTECIGHFDTPQCVDICPVDCIPKDPERVETEQQLYEKFLQLTGSEESVK
jgi:ferredoxin